MLSLLRVSLHLGFGLVVGEGDALSLGWQNLGRVSLPRGTPALLSGPPSVLTRQSRSEVLGQGLFTRRGGH